MKRTPSWASAAWETLGANAAVVVGGSAATLAVALHSWPIALAGGVAGVALHLVDRVRDKPARPPDPQTVTIMAALSSARAELDRTLAETSPSLRADIESLVVPIDELVRRATDLAARSSEIADYLRQHDVGALRRECDALGQRAAQTSDDGVRTQYLAARATRLGHVRTLGELAAAKERIGAALLSIVAAVEALSPKIVRLRGLAGAGDATGDVTDVEHELVAMTSELAAFERMLVQVNQEVTVS